MGEDKSFAEILSRRLSRRRVVAGGSELLAATALLQYGCGVRSVASEPSFGAIAASRADTVVVPSGYRSEVVLRWGDPLAVGVAPMDAERVAAGALLEAGAAAAQARQFGFNCDGLGLLPRDEGRLVVCVNHEFPSPDLMFPGWGEARLTRSRGEFVRRHSECVPYMQACVGLSVVELRRDAAWTIELESPLNRRITANTRMEFSGPARGHALLGSEVFGTFGNCAAGCTPWGTYLSAEENTDDYFGNREAADIDAGLVRAFGRFAPRLRDSAYRWEYVDARFDTAQHPAESLKFGWIVELDPRDPGQAIKKRTALGRFKHEGATTVLGKDGRAVVYMADDEVSEYLYKFVSAERFDPARPDRNRDLLDTGTLYVARFFDDGRGEWRPLVWGEQAALGEASGFASQADVVIRCREAADLLGATPLDRPEDVAVNPLTGRVYLACTQNVERSLDATADERGARGVNPRQPNPWGHIIELMEEGDDAAATAFRWEVFVLAGDPRADGLLTTLVTTPDAPLAPRDTYFAGFADAASLSAFANPDNLGFDAAGNLWIVTDGAQPRGFNNGCFVCPTAGPGRGAVRQFMSGPLGAEICGCEISADGRTLFLTVQHPGEGGSVENPISHWPDGGAAVARSSLIAIEPRDAGRLLGT